MKKQIDLNEIESKYLTIVSEFAIDMLSIHSTENTLWHLARNVVSELGFEDVVVYLLDEKRQVLCQKAAFGNKNPKRYEILSPLEIKVGEGVVGKVAVTKIPVLINDTRNFPDYIVDDESRLSELAVPMIVDGKVIGVIDSEHRLKGFYNQQHKKTLYAIASIAAMKISKNKTLNKLQHTIEELEYSSKIQDTLFEIAELIFETDSLKLFYQRLHACISRLTFAKNFYIALMNDDGTHLVLPYCADERDCVVEDEEVPINVAQPSITGYVMEINQPLLIHEWEIEQKIASKTFYLKGSLPKSWLGIPFGDNDNVKGIVVVQSYSDTVIYQEKDKQLLSFVAKHIYNAIERMNAKAELEFLALHDPLTHLPNRVLFTDRVEHAIDNAKRVSNTTLAVLYLDLDKFKHINDSFGHGVGDALLVMVSKTIRGCLKVSDTLCRLGGDEFSVLIETLKGIEEIEQTINAIVRQVAEIKLIDGHQVNISTSIGCAVLQNNHDNAANLFVQADEAMYQAKLQGRNQVCYHKPQNDLAGLSQFSVRSNFVTAIEEQQFYLEFQPIIELATGQIVAAEGLIRWLHPKHGYILPNQFLDGLQVSDLLTELDQHVVSLAIEFLQKEIRQLPTDFRLNINISGEGFNSPKLMMILTSAFELEPYIFQHLTLEITEQTLVSSVDETKVTIEALKRMGIEIALDDFGTGFSSLSYLHQFTFDCLKIDRSFISQLDCENGNQIILNTIINLAHSLGIKTVAEGVEALSQYKQLTKMECICAQGFYMSRPTSALSLVKLITSNISYLPK
ncbi:EAL domain-containing protein [Shewanella sp. UCD-KL12]|uniref:EAL domain-containing protein n=1 Tax=Shewanella sp. UCD-KL12 TaxID=1917163 RepID=UPI000970D612|nr:EAL domain-containing protein [Shewanella sp. UCD-KL12]